MSWFARLVRCNMLEFENMKRKKNDCVLKSKSKDEIKLLILVYLQSRLSVALPCFYICLNLHSKKSIYISCNINTCSDINEIGLWRGKKSSAVFLAALSRLCFPHMSHILYAPVYERTILAKWVARKKTGQDYLIAQQVK